MSFIAHEVPPCLIRCGRKTDYALHFWEGEEGSGRLEEGRARSIEGVSDWDLL